MENLSSHLNSLSETLNKRNAALKEVRSTLQKTEEERDEYWRRLQLEIRDKRTLTAKVKDLSEALELSDQRLRQSETARKALAKTLQKQTLEKPETPKLPQEEVVPKSLDDAYKFALAQIDSLTQKFQDERRKRLELKAAAKTKFSEFEDKISALTGEVEAARGWAEKCEELAQLREAERDEYFLESENFKRENSELIEFKKQALKQWMSTISDQQLSA